MIDLNKWLEKNLEKNAGILQFKNLKVDNGEPVQLAVWFQRGEMVQPTAVPTVCTCDEQTCQPQKLSLWQYIKSIIR